MATTLTAMLKEVFNGNYTMLEKAIDACPDSAWEQNDGGFPFWQQAAHTYAGINFLLRAPGDAPIELGVNAAALDFNNKDATPLSRAEIKKLIRTTMDWGLRYFDGLSDEDLPKKHEGFSRIRGADVPVIAVISLVNGHAMYHLGVCDSVLRANGLPGIL